MSRSPSPEAWALIRTQVNAGRSPRAVFRAAHERDGGATLAARYGVDLTTLDEAYERAGPVPPKYVAGKPRWRRYATPDASLFDGNTDTAAYWAGFLTGHGTISGEGSRCLRVAIREEDGAHLEGLAAALSTNSPVLRSTQQGKTAVGALLLFTSSDLIEALGRWGLFPRVHTEGRMAVPTWILDDAVHEDGRVARGYLRGVFDAYCTGAVTNPLSSLYINNSSPAFMTGIRTLLRTAGPQPIAMSDLVGRMDARNERIGTMRLSIAGDTPNLNRLAELLYDRAPVFLPRVRDGLRTTIARRGGVPPPCLGGSQPAPQSVPGIE